MNTDCKLYSDTEHGHLTKVQGPRRDTTKIQTTPHLTEYGKHTTRHPANGEGSNAGNKVQSGSLSTTMARGLIPAHPRARPQAKLCTLTRMHTRNAPQGQDKRDKQARIRKIRTKLTASARGRLNGPVSVR